jgi:hypothetical protein
LVVVVVETTGVEHFVGFAAACANSCREEQTLGDSSVKPEISAIEPFENPLHDT